MKWFPQLKKLNLPLKKDKKLLTIAGLFLVGCLFLWMPFSEEKPASNPASVNMINHDDTKKELEKLLSQITKTKVKVLFTYADNGSVEVVSEESYRSETNNDAKTSHTEKEVSPLLDNNKNVIVKANHPPAVKGVCIFYFGAYHPQTETLLCRAAKGALGAKLHTVEVIFQPNENEK